MRTVHAGGCGVSNTSGVHAPRLLMSHAVQLASFSGALSAISKPLVHVASPRARPAPRTPRAPRAAARALSRRVRRRQRLPRPRPRALAHPVLPRTCPLTRRDCLAADVERAGCARVPAPLRQQAGVQGARVPAPGGGE